MARIPRGKRPRDPNALAHYVVGRLTGEIAAPQERAKDPAAVELGRRGGQKGGKARAARLSPEERSRSAARAARARWTTRKRSQ